jgi:hypothetical protein
MFLLLNSETCEPKIIFKFSPAFAGSNLIVTFLAFRTTYLLNSDPFGTVYLTAFQVLVVFFVDAVKSIVFELHFGFAVTVDTPAHAQVGKLFHLAHFLDLAMTGLALHLARFYVL